MQHATTFVVVEPGGLNSNGGCAGRGDIKDHERVGGRLKNRV